MLVVELCAVKSCPLVSSVVESAARGAACEADCALEVLAANRPVMSTFPIRTVTSSPLTAVTVALSVIFCPAFMGFRISGMIDAGNVGGEFEGDLGALCNLRAR